MKLSFRFIVGIFLLIIFACFRYFGDYPEFIRENCERLLAWPFVERALSVLTSVMEFNTPDAAWLASKIVLFTSFFLNFMLIGLMINFRLGCIYLALAIGFILLSAIASPLGLLGLRAFLFHFTDFLSQAFLILVVYPAWRLYQLADQAP